MESDGKQSFLCMSVHTWKWWPLKEMFSRPTSYKVFSWSCYFIFMCFTD